MDNNILAIQEEVFKTIGNQKRLEIILLLEHREMNVSEMTAMLGVRQANLSQHLTLLRANHMVEVRKRGRESYYRLADESIAQAIRAIYGYLRKVRNIDETLDSSSLFPIVSDPICGMRFSATKAYSSLDMDGKRYYFCASGCETSFKSTRLSNSNQVHSASPVS